MSDLDTAAIRRQYEPSEWGKGRHNADTILRLCDALDAALEAEKRQHSERWFEKERAHKAEAEVERLTAELAGLRDLLDGAVLQGQGYCGGRHWNGGTCFHPAGHPEGFPAHFGQQDSDALARVVALLDNAVSLANAQPCGDYPMTDGLVMVSHVREAMRGGA